MSCQITTKKIEDILVSFVPVSFTMEQTGVVGAAFDKAAAYAIEHGGAITGSFMLYGECTEVLMNADCCMALKSLLPEGDGVQSKIVPGGEFLAASTVHKGPYNEVGRAWGELMMYVDKEGYTFSSLPMREVYLSDPSTTPESELLTEIIVPVQKA